MKFTVAIVAVLVAVLVASSVLGQEPTQSARPPETKPTEVTRTTQVTKPTVTEVPPRTTQVTKPTVTEVPPRTTQVTKSTEVTRTTQAPVTKPTAEPTRVTQFTKPPFTEPTRPPVDPTHFTKATITEQPTKPTPLPTHMTRLTLPPAPTFTRPRTTIAPLTTRPHPTPERAECRPFRISNTQLVDARNWNIATRALANVNTGESIKWTLNVCSFVPPVNGAAAAAQGFLFSSPTLRQKFPHLTFDVMQHASYYPELGEYRVRYGSTHKERTKDVAEIVVRCGGTTALAFAQPFFFSFTNNFGGKTYQFSLNTRDMCKTQPTKAPLPTARPKP